MENPFVAPDITDTVHEKVVAKRHAFMLLGIGALFAAALYGIYYLAVEQDYFSKPLDTVETSIIEDTEEPSPPPQLTVEERLKDLNEVPFATTSDMEALQRRSEEFNTPTPSGSSEEVERLRTERLKEFEQNQ